ncbi:MAG: hypothetical protein HUU56_11620 [Bdellovibrionaceae bacterium]|nr:hypothetical protein [Pseudobdellovibrionaceae bacterium]
METNLKERFLQSLKNHYPQINSQHNIDQLIDENLLCPFTLTLPQQVMVDIESFIKNFFSLRETPSYSSFLLSKYKKNDLVDPGNKSLFMSYDFHLDEQLQPQLIEVNTNAAFLALGYHLYETLQVPKGTNFQLSDLKNDFLQELELQKNKAPTQTPKVLIIDENPEQQRLFIEFLVYQELLKSFGWSCSIADYKNIESYDFNFIYNRWTDFYFSQPNSAHLKELYSSKKVCFSPNPYEYFLQADKQRLIDIHSTELWEKVSFPLDKKLFLQKHIPFSQIIDSNNKSNLWEQRKKLFFKPLNSFGSKQTYKGASISRKTFEEFNMNEFLAQEYISAPEIDHETPEGKDKFKYDLRCYAYKDQLQLVVARVYKGQVTNLKTKYGGFAAIKWQN